MAARQRFHVSGIATANHAGDRNSTGPGQFDDKTIARLKAVVCQPESAKMVIVVRVDAAVENHQIRSLRSSKR